MLSDPWYGIVQVEFQNFLIQSIPYENKMNQEPNTNTFGFACKQSIKMATPLVSSRITTATNRFVGMLMIAQLSQAALAAGALITTILMLLMVIGWSIMMAVGVYVGRIYGEGRPEDTGLILWQGLFLGTLIGIPLTLMMWNVAPFLLLLGQPKNVVDIAQQYFQGAAYGVLPSMWVVCCNQFLVGISRPKLIMIYSFVALPFTILLSYVWLFGRWGFPKLGVIGVAYANSLTFVLMIIFLLSFLYFRKGYRQFNIFIKRPKYLDYKLLSRLFIIGWPISVQFGAELIAFSVMVLMMGWIGEAALGAQQIIMQCRMMALMLPFGVSQGAAVLVSQAIGKKDYQMTKLYGYAGISIGVGFLLLIGAIYLIFPKAIISIFINIHNPRHLETIHIAILFFVIGAFSQIFDAIRNILTGALRGFHDTHMPMLVGIVVVWFIGVPIGYLLTFTFHWGAIGLPIAYTFGFILGAFILWRRFIWHVRRHQEVYP